MRTRNMPPLPARTPFPPWSPRIVCYFQTYHEAGQYCSLLPLVTNATGMTHIILAAIHINGDPDQLSLNDDPPDHEKYTQLWDEVVLLQDSGIKVLCMLGGAAKGSYARLDYSDSRTDIPLQRFEAYYVPLRDMIRKYNLDGIDLDVEEEMSLPGICHLIDRLKADFGRDFIITLAPVATALMQGRRHLSGFDYHLLEAARGPSISWYNTQFYNGWGDLHNAGAVQEIMRCGWNPRKVVIAMLTNPQHGGSGYLPLEATAYILSWLIETYPELGGVSGWEYWHALPQDDEPWMWPFCMALILGMKKIRDAAVIHQMGRDLASVRVNA